MKDKNGQILELSEDILKNIELNEIPLASIVLKCARLARLTGNQKAMDLFNYELAGYPKNSNGYVVFKAFSLARYANRTFHKKDKFGKTLEYMFPETVAELEAEVEAAKEQLKVAFDKDISVSSANPRQSIIPPMGNAIERAGLRGIITEKSKKIDQLKVAYYNYVLGVFYDRKFGDITEGIFQKRKLFVEEYLAQGMPDTLKKFVSVYDNLRSKNEEDWAAAVNSCRRIIKDVANFVYPPSEEEIEVKVGDGKKTIKIKLNEKNYIARLKQHIKRKASSEKFKKIVGSHLNYIGDRIDAIYQSTTKGTHYKVSQEEAERYVIYTYLLVSDILSL